MNKHILMALDHLANPDKYTQEQLKDNAFYVACYAAYYSAFDPHSSDAAVFTAAVAAADDINTEYWIDKYFEHPGENKDDYIKELVK